MLQYIQGRDRSISGNRKNRYRAGACHSKRTAPHSAPPAWHPPAGSAPRRKASTDRRLPRLLEKNCDIRHTGSADAGRRTDRATHDHRASEPVRPTPFVESDWVRSPTLNESIRSGSASKRAGFPIPVGSASPQTANASPADPEALIWVPCRQKVVLSHKFR